MVIVKQKKDFIREHLKSEIIRMANDLRARLQTHSFVFLEDPIPTYRRIDEKKLLLVYINRIGIEKLFLLEEIVPMEWSDVKNTQLMEIFNKLKDNKVFVYKDIQSKMMKCRVKKW